MRRGGCDWRCGAVAISESGHCLAAAFLSHSALLGLRYVSGIHMPADAPASPADAVSGSHRIDTLVPFIVSRTSAWLSGEPVIGRELSCFQRRRRTAS